MTTKLNRFAALAQENECYVLLSETHSTATRRATAGCTINIVRYKYMLSWLIYQNINTLNTFMQATLLAKEELRIHQYKH